MSATMVIEKTIPTTVMMAAAIVANTTRAEIGAAIEYPVRQLEPAVISRAVDRVGDAEQQRLSLIVCSTGTSHRLVRSCFSPPIGLEVGTAHLVPPSGSSWNEARRAQSPARAS